MTVSSFIIISTTIFVVFGQIHHVPHVPVHGPPSSSSSSSSSSSPQLPPGLIPMLDGRIVGGQTTRIEDYPYQISLRYMGNHRCGGSIIGKKLIVTAAHCVDNILATFLSIRAGITERSENGEERAVGRILMHSDYNRSTMNNDIAVLLLIRNLEYSNKIKPINLIGYNEDILIGQTAIVSGWGAIREGGPVSQVLQYVDVTIMSQNYCQNAYTKDGIQITENMICAGTLRGGKDACQGDSGGPLIIYDYKNEQYLIGVVSWGYGCARPKFPGVYSKVSALRKWIEESIKALKINL